MNNAVTIRPVAQVEYVLPHLLDDKPRLTEVDSIKHKSSKRHTRLTTMQGHRDGMRLTIKLNATADRTVVLSIKIRRIAFIFGRREHATAGAHVYV